MTREELWEEFENQLIRETRTSMTMNFDTAERMTKLGIKETVAKWKDRLEQEPCEDAVSRTSVFEILGNLMSIPYDLDRPINKDDVSESMDAIRVLPSVTPALKKCHNALKQESCEDVISRKEAKKLAWDLELETCYDNERVVEMLDDLPPVTPAPKKCHNENHDYAECDQFVCSNCGIELQDWHRVERDIDTSDITYHQYEFKYCPNCGAKLPTA